MSPQVAANCAQKSCANGAAARARPSAVLGGYFDLSPTVLTAITRY